jgi:hypothetical protein
VLAFFKRVLELHSFDAAAPAPAPTFLEVFAKDRFPGVQGNQHLEL